MSTHKCNKCGWIGQATETRKEVFGMGCPVCWTKRGQYIPVTDNKPQAKGWKI